MLITFSACKGDKKPTGEESSDSNVSTPLTSNESKEDEDARAPQEDTLSDDKTSVPSKPITSTETPVNKKTAKELIIGKWKYVTDISDILLDSEYEVNGEVNVTIISEFKADGTFNENADDSVLKSALQTAFADAYTDNIYNEFKESFTNSGKYKFDNDTLLIKFETDPDFTEITYKFNGDNKFTLETPSAQIEYSRF